MISSEVLFTRPFTLLMFLIIALTPTFLCFVPYKTVGLKQLIRLYIINNSHKKL